MTPNELRAIILGLVSLPNETEWIEFKQSFADPDDIGQYLSALSNSASLHGQQAAYLVWGVRDITHVIVGTTFRPKQAKKNGEELENYLARKLEPHIHFRIFGIEIDGKRVVLFEIPAATHQPVSFDRERWIRVGSYKKNLREYPEKEKALWAAFSRTSFEKGLAGTGLSAEAVLGVIDYHSYHELIREPVPGSHSAILERLAEEKIIVPAGTDTFNVTNLGAVLFARQLAAFDGLARKGIRLILYKGGSRVVTLREFTGQRGYAAGFKSLVTYINSLLPANEQMKQALRREVPIYPEIAVRELVANALIHQDFSLTGTGPMVEIFVDRIEITSPGLPLIDTRRFIDAPPQSRNDALAGLMRRLGVCEERGSGIDKVVFEAEFYQLPPPDFAATERHTRAILLAPRKLAEMTKPEKIRACYQHACLQHVSNKAMTNATLRKRLAITDANYSIASRIIDESEKEGFIKPYDPNSRSRKHARYLPFWA